MLFLEAGRHLNCADYKQTPYAAIQNANADSIKGRLIAVQSSS